ncbi:radical SAM protein [Solwaraspora sp. WMMA2080]|uniref:biotin synthase BioB n=1 Tax=unclassified Solwaraspora TaxID=2627926 RepID=UPI00248B716F|nr:MULTISPECIES: radical SAM protein [unclassified Solwaraspora]WBB97761.1 radical SAM protein [Solwaraspora sp. WMMA2059]WBC18349.1 radical SAM protein [Solwaraspora sp. WMMA2080]
MLDERDIRALLTLRGSEREGLFAQARAVRADVYGDQVVVRAVIEVTNLCRVDCDFCPMRRSNTRANDVFHQSPAEMIETAVGVHALGVNVICLQGGEVPQTTRSVGTALSTIADLYGGRVELLLNLGNKTRAEYAWLREQGATSYIIKHETSDPNLHLRVRHEALDRRLSCTADLLDLGYRVGSGMIVGLPGQTLDSIARDIVMCRDMGVHMMSAAPFVPAPDTPLADAPAGDVELTLKVIAAMRLAQPAWAIPSVSAMRASVDGGQRRGFDAGANVIVFNATPAEFRDKYLIYGKERKVSGFEYVMDVIAQAGLTAGGSVFLTEAGRS